MRNTNLMEKKTKMEIGNIIDRNIKKAIKFYLQSKV